MMFLPMISRVFLQALDIYPVKASCVNLPVAQIWSSASGGFELLIVISQIFILMM